MATTKRAIRTVQLPKIASARGKGKVTLAAAQRAVKKVLAAKAAAYSRRSSKKS